jgi:predicted nucleic-acid-binding protein
MRMVADTNRLVRLAVTDEPAHTRIASSLVREAEAVMIGNLALAELVWVLRSRYRLPKAEVIAAIENLCKVPNVVLDRAAAEAGLAAMRSGADFADAAIAYEGASLGGETFVSFDRKAVAALAKQGIKTKLLG